MDDHKYVSVYVPEYQASAHHSGPGAFIKTRLMTARRWWYRLSRLQKSFMLMVIMVLMVFSLIVSTLFWMPSTNTGANGPGPDSKSYFPQAKDPNLIKSDKYFSNYENFQRKPNPNLIVKSQSQFSSSSPAYTKGHSHGQGPMSSSLLDKPWEGLKLQKDGEPEPEPSVVIPLAHRDLKPDFHDVTQPPQVKITSPPSSSTVGFKNRIGEQVKENIRSVISGLEPVIPLHPKKSKSKSSTTAAVINKPFGNGSKLKFNGPENPRQKAVVDAFLHAWNGYKTYAWGKDHLRPITGAGQDWFGLGLTLVDSLDTMYIMGLNREFFEARDWVEEKLSFDIMKDVNLFETTIRVLGGLLSAYHLSGERIFLDKAEELGSKLLVGFKTPSGVPYSDVNLRSHTAHGPQWSPDSTTSEVSTIQLEFRDLSRCTNNLVYEDTAMNVSYILHKQPKPDGLVPIHISTSTGVLRSTSVITLGARGDSYYEYLVKQWIQTGKKIDFLRDDYLTAIEGVRDKLLRQTPISNLSYIGEIENNGKTFRPKMDHLVCYLPGTLALGHSHGLPAWHLELAKALLYTCYLTYKIQPTGLAPEITYFNEKDDEKSTDFYVKSNDAHNLLRPETVESLWYLYQLTGDEKYQNWGWEIFESFMKYTRVEHGFTSIGSVLNPDNTRPRDIMESFWLAETLKYFYLLFSPKPIFNLNEWVFNTEAHPLLIFDH